MKVYISPTQYNNFPHECGVLIRNFYPEQTIEKWNTNEGADIAIDVFDAFFSITIIEEGRKKNQRTYKYAPAIDLRRQIKGALFEFLAEQTGYRPPWGILQGIRPTKLIFKLKNIKDPHQQIVDQKEWIERQCIEQYKVSPPMVKLGMEVADYEERYIKKFDKQCRPLASIYISVPYCPTRCLYCSFPSNNESKYRETHQAYVEALIKELKVLLPQIREKYSLSTLYIGGGTPTMLSHEELDKLLTCVQEKIPLSSFREITVEAGRPDTVTKEKLMVLKKHKVQRISINPQSMHQETLDLIGRKHTVQDVKDAYSLAQKLGVSRVNMDVILGLPGETIEHVQQTFDEIERLNPQEITVHTLAIKKTSRLYQEQGQYAIPSRETMEEILAYSRQRLIHGLKMKPYYLYRQKNMVASYENIGYTAGEPCLYNMEIIEEAIPIFAFGAGGITKIPDEQGGVQRIENVKNVDLYIERIQEMINRKEKVIKKNDNNSSCFLE